MESQSRREFIRSAALAAGGLMLSSSLVSAASTAPAPVAEVKMQPLPFDAKKLIGLSEKMIRSHWENNYGGSVKTLNAVNRKLAVALADTETPAFLYGDLKREQLLRTGSVILHELYFENLGGETVPADSFKHEIARHFASFEIWQGEFKKIAQSLSGGSGWVILSFNVHFKKLENHCLADHLQHPPASLPLLVLDMFEHSYQIDYGATAAKYIDAFFANINWRVVESRFARLKPFF